MKHLLYLLLLLTLASCRTVKTVPIETIKTSVKHDTLVMNHQLYDSIYVFQDKYIDRSKDTVLIRQHDIEYRYKLLRDTLYKTRIEVQCDSIPYEVKVVETKTEKYVPWYIKSLAWIGAIMLILLILYLILKFTKR